MNHETMQSTESPPHVIPPEQASVIESFSARPSEADIARATQRRETRKPHGTHCSGAR